MLSKKLYRRLKKIQEQHVGLESSHWCKFSEAPAQHAKLVERGLCVTVGDDKALRITLVGEQAISDYEESIAYDQYEKMDVETARSIVDDDLPDGAYFAMLGELTGLDVSDLF